MTLNLQVVLLLSLHLLEGLDVSPQLVFVVTAGSIDVGSGIFFDLPACVLSKSFLLLFDPLALGSLGSNLHVSLAGAEDVSCPLLGLIELLPGLKEIKIVMRGLKE
jgi:hypothetical protein